MSSYVSQENAYLLKSLQQSTFTTNKVPSLGWWIGDYDQKANKWFEAAYPKSSSTVSGIVAGGSNPLFYVDLNPIAVKDGIDAYVYHVNMSVAPAATARKIGQQALEIDF